MQKDLRYYSKVHIFNDIYTFISISVFFRKLNFTLFLVGSTFWKASRLSEGKKKPKQSSDWIKELTLILPLSRKCVVFWFFVLTFTQWGQPRLSHWAVLWSRNIFNRNFLLELALGSAGSLKLALTSPHQADSFLPHLEP